MSNTICTREEVYSAIDGERLYQDTNWPQDPPLSPSEEFRLIHVILEKTHREWYATKDEIVNDTKVNPVDLEALRKIGAVAVRALETWGVIPRTDG
jgi:hypothetical protein